MTDEQLRAITPPCDHCRNPTPHTVCRCYYPMKITPDSISRVIYPEEQIATLKAELEAERELADALAEAGLTVFRNRHSFPADVAKAWEALLSALANHRKARENNDALGST